MVIKLGKLLYIVREDVIIDKADGYEQMICHNAIEGLEAFNNDPKVVIVDLGLPNGTGLDLLKIIRSNPFNHQIKIIVCSRNYNLRLINKAFLLGADFYITIPLDTEQIKFILADIAKNIKYIDYKKAFQFINYERKSLQNDNIEV